ncbi:MAG: hypothetical protein ACXWR0_18605 [Bdellovibrio sp.]
MKFSIRIATLVTTVMGFAVTAQAQMWGVGMYGGMQACPYAYKAAEGSSTYLDEIKEKQIAISDAETQLRKKKSEQRRLEKSLERSRRDVENVMSADYSDFMFDHMNNNYKCSEYVGLEDPVVKVVKGKNGKPTPVEAPAQDSATQTISGFTTGEWDQYCDHNKAGSINSGVCDVKKFQESERGRATAQDCKKGLTDYRKNYAQSQKLQREIDDLENAIKRSREDIQDARENYAEEQNEKRRENLEGGICTDCITRGNGYTYQRPDTDWGSVIGNVALGLVSMDMGYQTNKMVAQYNSNIGWPTNSYPAMGYGMPYFATGLQQALGGGSGIYGAIGGGIGAGGFGCAGMNGGPFGMMGPFGGMNGNGMWGNPYAMGGMNPFGGGGIYLPGMGPWGQAGPWGMGGPYPGAMGMPMSGMGMPMSGSMGMPMMGMPMSGSMGMPMMGMPMSGSMGMPMMGMPMSGSMGMPMSGSMGMPMMGMPMSGSMGMPMMGMPMSGSMGMPMMGMPMSGSMGMPMMGMPMSGSMGMPMMGMPMSGSMGMPMSGMPMSGSMGMPMMGGGPMGSLGALQMQQQMMQMQMQQYQMYMQQQQVYVQQQMQRQQVVMSLQQELYGLVSRIQQVQYGFGGSGYLGGLSGGMGINGGFGIGGGLGYGGGFGYGGGITPIGGVGGGIGGGVITPLPGSGGSGTGQAPIPAPR